MLTRTGAGVVNLIISRLRCKPGQPIQQCLPRALISFVAISSRGIIQQRGRVHAGSMRSRSAIATASAITTAVMLKQQRSPPPPPAPASSVSERSEYKAGACAQTPKRV